MCYNDGKSGVCVCGGGVEQQLSHKNNVYGQKDYSEKDPMKAFWTS